MGVAIQYTRLQAVVAALLVFTTLVDAVAAPAQPRDIRSSELVPLSSFLRDEKRTELNFAGLKLDIPTPLVKRAEILAGLLNTRRAHATLYSIAPKQGADAPIAINIQFSEKNGTVTIESITFTSVHSHTEAFLTKLITEGKTCSNKACPTNVRELLSQDGGSAEAGNQSPRPGFDCTTIADGADDGKRTCMPLSPTPENQCPACPQQQAFVNDLAKAYQTKQSPLSRTASERLNEALANCAKIKNFHWEDQYKCPNNEAFDCKDFSRWFRECMIRSGFADVDVWSMKCDNCESGKHHRHAINVYRRADGKYCPHEPQFSFPQAIHDPCCLSTKKEAMECAADIYCKSFNKHGDLCCTRDYVVDETNEACKEQCRWVTTGPDGKEYLKCGPVTGICLEDGPAPQPPAIDPNSSFLSTEKTICQKAQDKCVQDHIKDPPQDICAQCRKTSINECRTVDLCKAKSNRQDCNECCQDLYRGQPENISHCYWNWARCDLKS